MKFLLKLLSVLGFRVDFYVDLDGTIADLYSEDDWLERHFYDEDLFKNLNTYENFITVLRLMKMKYGPLLRINSLSAVMVGAEDLVYPGKNIWIDRHCSFFDRRFFLKNGSSKAETIKPKGKLSKRCILFDDFTANCNDLFCHGGYSVKVSNGRNCKGGSWAGEIIYNQAPIRELYENVNTIFINALPIPKKLKKLTCIFA